MDKNSSLWIFFNAVFLQIEALESKVQKELVDVKEKIQKMQDEIVEFSDLDGLRLRAEEKRKNLAVEKDELEAKKTALTFTLQDIETATRMLTVSFWGKMCVLWKRCKAGQTLWGMPDRHAWTGRPVRHASTTLAVKFRVYDWLTFVVDCFSNWLQYLITLAIILL